MNITIEGKVFQIKVTLNQTSKELIAQLPMNLSMNDLNDNEKYVYLPNKLPTHATRVNKVEKGDVMLFDSDCLVLFYETFSTNYSYTKIGTIKYADQLDFLTELETVSFSLIP